MKRENIRIIAIIVFMTCLLSFTNMVGAINQNNEQNTKTITTYTDYDTSAWWKDSVKLAVEKGLLKGYYEDSEKYGKKVWKLKPNKVVTEAEYLTILLRQTKKSELNLTQGGDKWYDASYQLAKKLNLPALSYNNDGAKNNKILRGNTAVLVASAALGKKVNTHEAIGYLYEIGFKGRSADEKTYRTFAPNDQLTRAEAATFIQNLEKNGIQTIKEVNGRLSKERSIELLANLYGGDRKKAEEKYNDLYGIDDNRPTNPPTTLDEKIEKVKDIVEQDGNLKIETADSGASIRDKSRNKVIVDYTIPSENMYNRDEVMTGLKPTTSDIKLAAKTAVALGFPMSYDQAVAKALEIKKSQDYRNSYETTINGVPVQIAMDFLGIMYFEWN